ncbi:MAG: hypothetical protein LBC27_07995 [Spirochaetaceae bacterium]|jgi:hypothetical protein|nr:hypothetical protein [Spirochaetaceae bacterium]
MKNYITNCLVFTFLISSAAILAAQQAATEGLAPNTDLSKLTAEKPVIISSNVEFVPGSDNKWIAISAEVQAITLVPIEKLYAVLHDIENQPKVFNKGFSSTKKAVIDSTTPNGTIATFTTTAVGQDTVYTALVTEKLDLPNSAFITVKQTAPNKQIRNLYATWYLSTQTIDGVKYSYIRFYDSSEVAGDGLKKALIGGGINSAHTSSISQLIEGAKKR